MAAGTNMTGSASPGLFSTINPVLLRIAKHYWHVHPYTSVSVCAFGIITNVFNIVTLTCPHMRNSINSILTAIAVCDILTMASYIPFIAHFYLDTAIENTPTRKSYGWMTFLYCHQTITTATHNASIWLAVFLAILRYRCVQSNVTGQVLTNRSTILYTLLVFTLSFLILIPNYVKYELIPIYGGNCNSSTPTADGLVCYSMYNPNVGSTNPNSTDVATFWIYALIGKLIPCLLMTTFGLLLLRTLKSTQRRSERLVSTTNRTRMKQHSRTTRMLLAVIVMFLVTELPQGVALVMSGSFDGFLMNVYTLLGDLLDMLALLNNSVNFILYCTMSQQYRQTFARLVCPKLVARRQSMVTSDTIALRSNMLTNG